MTTRYVRAVRLGAWLLMVLSLGCAEAPKRPEESARVRLITAWVEDLRQAYEARDREALVRLLPPAAASTAVVEALNRALAGVENIHVRFLITRIVFENQMAAVGLSWEGTGRPIAGGNAGQTRFRGEATVRFTTEGPSAPPRPIGLAGDLPFGVTTR